MSITKLALSVWLLVVLSACSNTNSPTLIPAPSTEPTTIVTRAPTTAAPLPSAAPATAAPTLAPSTPTLAPTAAPPAATPTVPPAGTTGPGGCILRAAFVRDVTIPDGTLLAPNAAFTKTWRVRNTGTCQWTVQYILAFVSGTDLSDPVANPSAHAINPTPPGGTVDISVPMHAPASGSGQVISRWRLVSSNNVTFGPLLTTVIRVSAQTPAPNPTPIPPQDANRGDPFRLIAAYFDAINRKDYTQAFTYRLAATEGAPSSATVQAFTRGYSDTVSIIVVVNPLVSYDAAAGSVYVQVPTLLGATRTDGTQQAYLGCYTLRRVNPFNFSPPRDYGWQLVINDSQPSPFRPVSLDTDASALAQPCADAQPPPQPYDIRSDPHSLIGSYYDAITRKDYARAYRYWESPPFGQSEAQFTAGFQDTASALVVMRPTAAYQGAAGSQFAGIATLVLATKTDTSKQAFAGCLTARRVNPQIPGAPPEGNWRLYAASLATVPSNASPLIALALGCAQ